MSTCNAQITPGGQTPQEVAADAYIVFTYDVSFQVHSYSFLTCLHFYFALSHLNRKYASFLILQLLFSSYTLVILDQKGLSWAGRSLPTKCLSALYLFVAFCYKQPVLFFLLSTTAASSRAFHKLNNQDLLLQ